jgi:hypothetical protein
MVVTTHIKENAMRFGQTLGCLLAILAAGACRPNPLIPEGNKLPVANAGPNQVVDYAGAPVAITLDGSGSSDADGVIRHYQWLSATPLAPDEDSDGGAGEEVVPAGGRVIPPGEPIGWPEDVVSPMVTLDQGVHYFTLWVTDDRGAMSPPDTVEIRIGADPVAACIQNVYASTPPACAECLCGVDDQCRAAADQTVCGEACWGLIDCIAVLCPTYRMDMNVQCLIDNCSATLQAGAMGATMLRPCIEACLDVCDASQM